jgi:DNA-binding CsgD family transcriptional regulator
MSDLGYFVGRRAELTEIMQLAQRVRSGEPWAVLVEGAAGTGKTSLIGRALAGLTDFTVLHAAGDLAGAESGLMMIGRLLRANESFVPGFVSPPRVAGEAAGERAARELLALLAAMCVGGPVAVVLEDAQWADLTSVQVLGSVLRRLRAEPVLVIAAVRPACSLVTRPGTSADHWHRALLGGARSRHLLLAGLTVSEVAALAEQYRPGGHDETTSQWLHQYTGGIPALLAALLPGLAADAPWEPGMLPRLPQTAVAVVSGMLAWLPEDSRSLLAALAVLGDPSPLAVVGSVAGIRDASAALEPLIEAGLAAWDPGEVLSPVSIRHPLHRDAVYRLLSAAQRRGLHGAAARHVSGISRWRHQVGAAEGPDADLAAALEKDAERYGQGGDLESAGKLLLWSSDASEVRADRERRLLLGVEQFLVCQRMDLITGVQPHLEACPPSTARNLALGLLAERAGRRARALVLLSEARRFADAGDARYPVDVYVDLALAMVHAEMGHARAEHEAAVRLLAAPRLPELVREGAQFYLIDAAGRADGGPAAALRLLADTATIPSNPADLASGGGVLLWARGMWRSLAGQLTAARDDLATVVRSANALTIASIGPHAQADLAFTQFRLGQWSAAAATADQAVAAAGSTTTAWLRVPAHSVAACIAAARGEWQQAAYHSDRAERWQDRAGEAYVAFPAAAAATIAGARSDYPAMLAALQPLRRRPGPAIYQQAWWRPLLVEALIGAGQLAAAGEALADLERFAVATGQLETALAWLGGWLAASNGDRAAVARFEEAVGRPAAPDDIPFHRARLAHEYGRFLLSLRQRRPAIRWLREAHRRYAALGARPYLERCEADLLDCGVRTSAQEPAAAPDGQPPAGLTAQERRIAYLVACGLTNHEVGSELYVSAKTVEYHLGNIFAKLGITSRRQLRSLNFGQMSPAPGRAVSAQRRWGTGAGSR